MFRKYPLKIKINNNNTQSNLSLILNSRNELYSLSPTKSTTLLSNNKSLSQKLVDNKSKYKKLFNNTKYKIIHKSKSLYNENTFRIENQNNNKINSFNNVYQISKNISKNNNASFPKIIQILKKNIKNKKYKNKNIYNESFLKNDKITQNGENKTQRSCLKSKSIIKEKMNERDLNNIYYKIFPKDLKEKPIKKNSLVNNIYNYYICSNNEQFKIIINRENQKRKILNKALIKLPINNEDTKKKLTLIRKKTKFIGSIVNYCYSKVSAYKIIEKMKQIEEQKNKLYNSYILPKLKVDLLKKKQNENITKNFINNSLYIINENNSMVNNAILTK